MAKISGFDLDEMSAKELTDLIAAAEAKRKEKQEEAKAAFITETRDRAAALGLSLDDLNIGKAAGARKTRKDAGTTAEPKFKGPGGETWTGRGRPPAWLITLEGEGRKRDEFRI